MAHTRHQNEDSNYFMNTMPPAATNPRYPPTRCSFFRKFIESFDNPSVELGCMSARKGYLLNQIIWQQIDQLAIPTGIQLRHILILSLLVLFGRSVVAD